GVYAVMRITNVIVLIIRRPDHVRRRVHQPEYLDAIRIQRRLPPTLRRRCSPPCRSSSASSSSRRRPSARRWSSIVSSGRGELMKTLIAALIVLAASTYELRAQSPAFDVVSIKKNTSGAPGQNRSERPDGGLRMLNVPLGMLIAQAYPPGVPVDIVG